MRLNRHILTDKTDMAARRLLTLNLNNKRSNTMDLTTEYVSKICPELLASEVKILIDNLLDLYDPSEIYPQVVRVTAKSLFPYVVTTERVVEYLDGRDRIVNAIEFLKAAHNQLNKIPKLSDNCGMAMLEINQWTNYLNDELRDLEKGNAKEQ